MGKGLCVPRPCGQLGGPTTEGVQEHSELWSLTPGCGHEVRPHPHDGVMMLNTAFSLYVPLWQPYRFV